MHPKFSHILSWSLLEGIDLLTEGCQILLQCHNAHPTSGGCHSGWCLCLGIIAMIQKCKSANASLSPAWAADNKHIPLPPVVDYSIYAFSSLMMGRLTFTWRPLLACTDLWLLWGCSHHCWVHWALIIPSIRTFTSRRGWVSWRTSRNPWCSLSPVLSTLSNDMLGLGVPASPSHFPITCSLVQPSHPVIYFAGTSQGLDGSPWPLGLPQPSGIHFLLHDSCFHPCCSPGPINWTCQPESNIPCTSKGKPFFAWSSSKEQDSFPWCQDHSFSKSFFKAILEHVSYQWSIQCMGRWRLVASPSPKVTLTWMQ